MPQLNTRLTVLRPLSTLMRVLCRRLMFPPLCCRLALPLRILQYLRPLPTPRVQVWTYGDIVNRQEYSYLHLSRVLCIYERTQGSSASDSMHVQILNDTEEELLQFPPSPSSGPQLMISSSQTPPLLLVNTSSPVCFSLLVQWCNTDLIHRMPWKLMDPPQSRLSRKHLQGFLQSTYCKRRVINTP